LLNVDTLLNWIVVAVGLELLATIVSAWLLSYRDPRAAPVGPGKWIFTLPTWAQIGGGLAITLLLAYVSSVLWIPLPFVVSAAVATILRLLGFTMFLVGVLAVFWARWTLGAMYGVSTSSAVQLKERHRLIQRGPYVLVRHPMYLGYWLVIARVTLIYRTWSPLLWLVVCVPAFNRRARREEQALAALFGVEWQVYAARVPMFVPRWRMERVERRG
jgi:protein-S-isoprenylcysteine O-methyltransferase Ste14